MTTKKAVIGWIRRMPSKVTIPDIVEMLADRHFRQRVEAGLAQLDRGESVSHDQVKARLKKWLA